MNPLKEKAKNIDSLFMSLDKTYPKPYDKNETDAYSKTSVILMLHSKGLPRRRKEREHDGQRDSGESQGGFAD